MADIAIGAAAVPAISERSRLARHVAAFSLLSAISLVPLFLVNLPPLNDYPNHLARCFIQIHASSSPVLSEFYRPAWALQPNLAIDLVLSILGRAFDIEVAGKIFIGLVFLSITTGVWMLHWVLHRQLSYWPLAAFLLLYNRILLGGMVNYLFTLGLALWALAGWIGFREAKVSLRVIVALPVAFVLYLCHFEAFGIYALALMAYEAARARGLPWRTQISQLTLAGIQFILPMAVFATMSRTASQTGAVAFSGWTNKLTTPLNLFYNYHAALDGVSFLLICAIIACGIVRRELIFAKWTTLPLLTLGVVYLAMPDMMLASHGADRRIPLAFALLLIGMTEWRWRSNAVKFATAAALFGLFILRMAAVAAAWQSAGSLYSQYLEAFSRLPVGAKMAVATAHKWNETTVHPPVHSIAAMAVIERSAFVPVMYADPREEALDFTPEYKRLADLAPARVYFRELLDRMKNPQTREEANPFRADRLAPFQYLLAVNPADFPVPPPETAKPIFTGRNFVLYDLSH